MTSRGLVIARHRREVLVEDESGQTHRGLIRGRKLKPLTGDEVSWSKNTDGSVVIETILPRRSILERIDSRGRAEGVAANVSLILVVVAPEPAPDWQLVDRYLIAAALMDIEAALIRNKRDRADAGVDAHADAYKRIGYRVDVTSARDRRGIAELGNFLAVHRAVLVGQSGVGKSSLLNALLAEETQAVGHLSRRKGLGRHTTTASVLHRLPNGGELIDSPGVRRYAPHIEDESHIERGYIEFRPWLGQCRFSDCRHAAEPECAIRSAVDRGDISENRYRSYLRLRQNLSSLHG